MINVGYIGNYYKIPEFIMHSEFELKYVIVEAGKMSSDMYTFLKVRNIEYIEVSNSNELIDSIRKADIKTWITCSYGKRIHTEEINDVEIYNIHYAKLPYYKGRHPTFYATVNDEKSIGITLHKIEAKLDQGEMISQKIIPYYLWENENNLFEKLTLCVPDMLKDLYRYIEGEIGSQGLIEEGNYYAPVREKDITLDIKTDSVAKLYNTVRAQAKYDGAIMIYDNKKYYVKELFFSREEEEGFLNIPRDDYYIVMRVEVIDE